MKSKKEPRLDPGKGDFVCTHVMVEMDYPKTKNQIEDFFFYLYHEGIGIFIGHDGGWYVYAEARCSQLTVDGRCLSSPRQAPDCTHLGHGLKTIEDASRFHFRDEYRLSAYLKEHRPALFAKLHPDTQKLAEQKPLKEKKVSAKNKLEILDHSHDCSVCDKCCSYLNLIIDDPRNEDNVRSALWFIYHNDCNVYHDRDGDWSLLMHRRCVQLGPEGLCSVYDRRPSVCRKFSSKNCHGTSLDGSVRALFPTDRSFLQYLGGRRPAVFKRLSSSLRKLTGGRKTI